MYKLIACDLDETLLSDDTHVCQRNRDAIMKLQQLGVKFVLATGRGYISVQNTLKELNLAQQENEYVISFNGACISENKNNHVLNFNGLEHQQAQKLYQYGQNYDVCMHVYTKDMVYVYNMDEDERNYMSGRHAYKEIDTDNLDFLKTEDIAKVLYQNTDQEYLHMIAESMGELGDQFDISYSSNRYLEFNKKGVNKGEGLIWLAQQLKIKPEEIIAMGDNINDLSMITRAGLGVGMQNSNPAIKPYCDYITEADNNNGGVAEAIEKFVLADRRG